MFKDPDDLEDSSQLQRKLHSLELWALITAISASHL